MEGTIRAMLAAADSGEYQAIGIDHLLYEALCKAKGLKVTERLVLGEHNVRVAPCFYLVPGAQREV